ncbi:MAG: hypothetical protein RLZZ612_2383 [Pseudomonadota bacterium]|jgi:hypothetical protein
MTEHSHNLRAGKWPFADQENVAAICCKHVLEGHPVLRVTHDEDDGAWQILCGGPHIDDDAKVVCLGCMVKRDESLIELADLPLGWCADRIDVDSQWVREENAPYEDDA